jgi:hypothetical protein
MKKYEMTDETKIVDGHTLHRIRALVDIPRRGVKAGDLGGWIESEGNLSQYDSEWIDGNVTVYSISAAEAFTQGYVLHPPRLMWGKK